MKFGLIVVVLAFLSAVAAQALLSDPGYVAISIRGYTIESSVPVLLGGVVALVFALWAAKQIWQAPRRLGAAYGRGRAERAGKKLTAGMIEVAEGNFARGEKLLARAAGSSTSPLFNYLQAARAAHLQGHDERRDEWLKLAYAETPEATNAVLLTQAEFQLDRGQYEHALATLRRIEENSRDHSYANALLGRLYFRLEDWDSLRELLPRLGKHGRVNAETVEKWTVRAHAEALAGAPDGDALIARWNAVPRKYKNDERLLEPYYTALIRVGMHDKAEKELVAALKARWRGPLVRLYGMVEGMDATKQLKQAETWLQKHAEDPDLLLAAARLCLRNELWGKARSYLESVITLRPTPEAYQVYGRLLNQLGEGDAAADAYRDGLNMVADGGKLTAIPHLDAD
ncbi:MAG: heme biosynthesis HemY N-terminal domain-containing protein [Woeseiaceae bacterium]|nr:heme biosynthesis HemY N-terminal domain-containing protein [Woeseiaceae bacterium]